MRERIIEIIDNKIASCEHVFGVRKDYMTQDRIHFFEGRIDAFKQLKIEIEEIKEWVSLKLGIELDVITYL